MSISAEHSETSAHAELPLLARTWNSVTRALSKPLPITRVLWGVFSNGEFGPGIEPGLAFFDRNGQR